MERDDKESQRVTVVIRERGRERLVLRKAYYSTMFEATRVVPEGDGIIHTISPSLLGLGAPA